MSPIDLHVHTSHSHDGDVDPARIIRTAAEKGIKHLAITDHNRTTAVQAALDAAVGTSVEVIPGIELDCNHEGVNLHLLGYYVDHTDPRFRQHWEEGKIRKTARNHKRIEGVLKLGFHIDAELVLATAREGVVSNVGLGGAVLSDPRNQDNPALAPYRPGGEKTTNPIIAFCWDFFSQGSPAYVEDGNPSLPQALDLVVSTGGVPVLAHPGANLAGKEELLSAILACGVRGVEAYCGYHSPEQARFWTDAARCNDVFITCGSDFHGSAKPAIRLGEHGGEGFDGEVMAALRECAPASAR